jgi:hypothetical protein
LWRYKYNKSITFTILLAHDINWICSFVYLFNLFIYSTAGVEEDTSIFWTYIQILNPPLTVITYGPISPFYRKSFTAFPFRYRL